MIALVMLSLIREPHAVGPPVQPVLTSHASDRCLLDPLGEHLGVPDRMQDQERGAEAGRERHLGLRHADFGPATLAV